jgi:hypothetical protein
VEDNKNQSGPDDQYELPRELVVTDLEAVRALTDPLKMQILESVGRAPKTVKQIAASLKVVPNNLYYHINQLEKLNLIRVVNTRVVSGIIEKQYSAAAVSYTFSRTIISQHNPDKAAVNEAMNTRVLSVLEMTRLELKETVQAGLLEGPLNANLISGRHKFTPAQVDLMNKRLQELINSPEFEDTGEVNQEEVHEYRVFFNVFPLVDKGSEEPD